MSDDNIPKFLPKRLSLKLLKGVAFINLGGIL
jgi:hypothetical protein